MNKEIIFLKDAFHVDCYVTGIIKNFGLSEEFATKLFSSRLFKVPRYFGTRVSITDDEIKVKSNIPSMVYLTLSLFNLFRDINSTFEIFNITGIDTLVEALNTNSIKSSLNKFKSVKPVKVKIIMDNNEIFTDKIGIPCLKILREYSLKNLSKMWVRHHIVMFHLHELYNGDNSV